MKKFKEQLRQLKWYNFIILLCAGIINAVGVGLFLVPSALLDGGISGTSFLLNFVTNVDMSIFLISLNLPFFLVALKKQGLKFFIYSIFAIGVYALTLWLFQSVFKLCGEDMNQSPITNDIFLAAVFGGLISGVGSGLTIKVGGSVDGIEALSVMVSKKIGLTVGQFIMVYNIIIFTIAGFVIGFNAPLYSIVAYAIGVKVVDGIVEGINKSKMVLAVTEKSDEIALELSKAMGKGVTLINARGYYSSADKVVLYFIVNRFQINKLKNIIKEVDPNAFVTISEVSEMIVSAKK